MAALFKGLFADSKPSAAPVPATDSDFADYAEAPEPSPEAFSAIPSAASYTGLSAAPTGSAAPFTRWYNVHERHSLSEFKLEGAIFLIIFAILGVHFWGAKTNRAKAKAWAAVHAPSLQKEFALVGFGKKPLTIEGAEGQSPPRSPLDNPDIQILKEQALNEFKSYASGRANVAFVDVRVTLHKRYNPFMMFVDYVMSFFFDTMPNPTEKMETVIYPFDGRENTTVPGLQIPGAHELRNKDTRSTYDGFVWAVVNKDEMKQLRDERYDVSITTTKDNSKLPIWATVMSEAAEITDFLLTPELIKAIEEAGELMNYLVITDQPVDKPTTLDETTPKKRIFLSVKIPSSAADYAKTMPLFEYSLRVPDLLVQSAHLRPEVMRKVRATRDEHIRKLQKADEDEKAEERALEREKAKKLKRDLELKGMDAKAQKKYLEKEKEKDMRRAQKKQTVKG